MPSALWLILGEDIPGLAAVTPASAAAAKFADAMTDLGNLGEGVSLGFRINASSEIVGRSYLDKVFVFNDNGQIVASAFNAQGQEHAFLLTKLASAPRIYRPPA